MTALEMLLHDEIARTGPMPFARFMALALYHPEHGYYEREADPVGRAGDFYTSVSVGPLFGELLARRFAGWLASIGVEELHLMEAGAHDGQLAADMLGWLRTQRPALMERLRYTIIEPSTRRRQRQERRLEAFGESVGWVGEVPLPRSAGLRPGAVTDADGGVPGRRPALREMATSAAVIFGNELLDAFPVHRVGWDASVREWFEWAVAADGSGFAWTRLPLPKSLEALLLRWLAVGTDWGEAELAALIETLPDGFILELSPAAEAWWSAAAQALSRGWLVAFDYGFAAGEQVRPERTHGTLRAYRGHTVNDDLLASPGEQDLTAHVNFAVLQAAGEAAGLRTVELSSQERFLTRVAAELPGGWTAADTRQLRTLVHPGHLGRAFRVLVQERA